MRRSRARVRGAWLALGGPATVAEPLDLAAADRYFALLAAHERAGDVPDWAGFVAALGELKAADAADATTRLRVMTMHKAKGLEFDTVIVVGAGRGGRGARTELLRWRGDRAGCSSAPSVPAAVATRWPRT